MDEAVKDSCQKLIQTLRKDPLMDSLFDGLEIIRKHKNLSDGEFLLFVLDGALMGVLIKVGATLPFMVDKDLQVSSRVNGEKT